MVKYKGLFLALALAVFLIPLSFYLKKFTTIRAYEKPKVILDTMTCFVCEKCPCDITLDDGTNYRLLSSDKVICQLPEGEEEKARSKSSTTYTSYLDIKDYLKYEQCVKWYSIHPSIY